MFMRADFVMSISHSGHFQIKKIPVAKVHSKPNKTALLETRFYVVGNGIEVAVQQTDVAVTVVQPHGNHIVVVVVFVCLTVTFRP